MSVLTSTPFTWSHMKAEDGTYMAELGFPISQFVECTQFISNQLRGLDLSPEVYTKDWACSSTFTIPYMMYNEDRSEWNLDAEHAKDYILQMVKTYSS